MVSIHTLGWGRVEGLGYDRYGRPADEHGSVSLFPSLHNRLTHASDQIRKQKQFSFIQNKYNHFHLNNFSNPAFNFMIETTTPRGQIINNHAFF